MIISQGQKSRKEDRIKDRDKGYAAVESGQSNRSALEREIGQAEPDGVGYRLAKRVAHRASLGLGGKNCVYNLNLLAEEGNGSALRRCRRLRPELEARRGRQQSMPIRRNKRSAQPRRAARFNDEPFCSTRRWRATGARE